MDTIHTTGFSTIEDQDGAIVLGGNEQWPILGSLLPESIVCQMVYECAGLRRYWDCLGKAQVALNVFRHYDSIYGFGLGTPTIVLGSLFVWSGDWKSSYGFAWNPPFEFHAWVEFSSSKGILDVALPGVIEKGLRSSDSDGPYLISREPAILNGDVPSWIEYEKVCLLEEVRG